MNYFNYFTDIETRFQQRRGSLLMLSTLDWALIETWREAGIPLEAVLRGIDAAFDKHAAQALRSTRRQRKINGLAWCAQAVLEAVEQSKEAAIGTAQHSATEPRGIRLRIRPHRPLPRTQRRAPHRSRSQSPRTRQHRSVGGRLSPARLAVSLDAHSPEVLDRTLSVLEEKLFAALLTAAPGGPSSSPCANRPPAARPLPRQDAGRSDQAGAAAIPAEAPARSPLAAPSQPLLHAPRRPGLIDAAITRSRSYPASGPRHSPLPALRPLRRMSAPASSPTQRSSATKPLSSERASKPLASRCPCFSSTPPRRSPTATASASPSPKSTASSAPATSTHPTNNLQLTTCTPPSSPSPSAPSLPPSSGAHRSPPRAAQPIRQPLAAQSHPNPRPARTLHHRRRVPPPAHPLPAHRREVTAKKTHRRLHHSLRIPPRPHPRTHRRRNRLLPMLSRQRSRRNEQPRPGPTWGSPGLNYSISAKNQIVILSGAKNPGISPLPLSVRTANLEPRATHLLGSTHRLLSSQPLPPP